jgi:hypothetical protein
MAPEGTAPGLAAERAWDQNVSSYAIDDGERLLLFAPIPPPSEIEKLAAQRETAIVLGAPWHERDTQRQKTQREAQARETDIPGTWAFAPPRLPELHTRRLSPETCEMARRTRAAG